MKKYQLYMEVARLFADQSTCLRGKIGAVIVRDGRVISTGYVGAPPGQSHCTDVGCQPISRHAGALDHFTDDQLLKMFGCQRTIHAETNALLWAARAGVKTQGADMFCTHSPCVKCAQAIIAAGIISVTYEQEYRIRDGIDLLHDAGVRAASLEYRLRHG